MLLKEDTASKVQFKKSVFCHNCQSVGANFDQNWIVHFTKIELQHVVIFKKNVYVFFIYEIDTHYLRKVTFV